MSDNYLNEPIQFGTIETSHYILGVLAIALIACNKGDLRDPDTPPRGDGPYFEIKVKAIIAVGDVVYDSISAPFHITTWDKHGVAHQMDTMLAAGVNRILLPTSHIRFHLRFARWNVSKDTTFGKADVQENAVYVLRAQKTPKLLKQEVNYHHVSGSFKTIGKTEYAYIASRLSEVTFRNIVLQGGLEQFEPVKKELITYEGPVLTRVKEVYLKDSAPEPAQKVFVYDSIGNVQRVKYEFPSEIYAYRYERAAADDQTVRVFQEGFPNPSNRYYQLKFEDGNLIEHRTVSDQDNYGNTYKFDQNINPYLLLRWPDVWYNRQSKNNVVADAFFNGGVINEVARFEYTFDDDGYVTEVIRKQRDPVTGSFTIKSKKVLMY